MSSSIASESEPVKAGVPTAVILPFPTRPKTEPRPEDRLSKALASLNAALAQQRVALAAWRGALGELKETTTGLGESLQRYRASLGSLGGSVATLHDQARSLEQWADSVLSDSRTGISG